MNNEMMIDDDMDENELASKFVKQHFKVADDDFDLRARAGFVVYLVSYPQLFFGAVGASKESCESVSSTFTFPSRWSLTSSPSERQGKKSNGETRRGRRRTHIPVRSNQGEFTNLPTFQLQNICVCTRSLYFICAF